MKKIINAVIALTIFIILILVFHFWGNKILNNAALTFRPWVDAAAIVTVGISVNIIVVLVIAILIKIFKKQGESTTAKIFIKVICTIGIVICIVTGLCTAWATLIGSAYGYCEEYVVYRDKRKMVAVVNSFLDVNVYYYQYKNWIVMGSRKQIYEWYGNGGYDPLDGKHTNLPRKTIYYYEWGTNSEE